MNYILIKQEVKVLKHLADGKQHSEAPAGMTGAQFYAALKSLKAKNLVYAALLEGGEVCSSQIKTEGRAVLDDFTQREKRVIRKFLMKSKLTHEQYHLLVDAKTYIDTNGDNDKAIMDLYRRSYLKRVSYGFYSHWTITPEGEDVLDEIDDRLYGDVQGTSLQGLGSKEQAPPTEIVKQPNKKSNMPNIHIAPKHITDVIKVFDAMCKLGYFNENDEKASAKNVMKAFGEILHSEQLGSQYSTLLNKATKGTKNTFLQTFEDLVEKAEEFYDNREERKIN